MAARQRPPTGAPQQQPQAQQQQQQSTNAVGFDAVYNWFNTVSSGGFGNLFSSGGLQGGLGGLGSMFGSGATSSAPSSSGISSMSHLGMVCRAPQLRPSTHEGVVEREQIQYDQNSVYGRPPDSSPDRRSGGASPSSVHPSLSPRHEGASSSSGRAYPVAEGGGGASASRRSNSKVSAYEVDKEDLLDQHVGYYLRHHPEVHALHSIVRKRPGIYDLDGREIKVEWQYATEPGGQGFLVALDGPLRQPFADYMEMTEANAEYDSQGIGSKSALHSIPKEKRMSFHDQHKMYNRLEAMKVAKEQALVREKAADYVKDGREVPGDLMAKYKKTIQMKLDPGGRRASAARQRSQEMNAAMANATGPSMAPGAPSVRQPGGAGTPQPPAPGPLVAQQGPAGQEDAANPGPGNRSAGEFVVPTPDQPDNVGLPSLEGLGLGPPGGNAPMRKGSDGVARYTASQAQPPPERQISGPVFAAPPHRARPRARTESPASRQPLWPSYVPPGRHDADAGAGSYVPPVMHEGLSRSYVPPIAPEYQGRERRSVSNEWTGAGPFSWVPPPVPGAASGAGAGGGSPHNQAPPGGGAGWQGSAPSGGRSTAAQLLGPQPSIFGPSLPGTGAQMGQSLGAGQMPPGPVGLGPGGMAGQQPQAAQQQQQYTWWQQ